MVLLPAHTLKTTLRERGPLALCMSALAPTPRPAPRPAPPRADWLARTSPPAPRPPRAVAAAATPAGPPPLYLGVDAGTSGVRACLIDGESLGGAWLKILAPVSNPLSPSLPSKTVSGAIAAEAKVPYVGAPVRDWAAAWKEGVTAALAALPRDALAATARAAVAGTSASVLLVDPAGDFTAPLASRLYSDGASQAAVDALRSLAGGGHTATAPTASAAKAMDWWLEEKEGNRSRALIVASAADWISALLAGDPARLSFTDDNNALKAGWDPGHARYERWLAAHPVSAWLAPAVVRPGGDTVSVRDREAAPTALLPPGCMVAGGTTDSIAAYIAALGPEPAGVPTAVTSLGSTLALKLASPARVDDPASGIYSHRLGEEWLVGGASNVGCAALADFFSPAELKALSSRIDPAVPSPIDFYPLPAGVTGERFPVPDAKAVARVTPRPADDAAFLAGLLEGIARVEAAGYERLAALGAPFPARVLTAGGGAANETWAGIRARVLGVEDVGPAVNGEAAYGAALLARGRRG